MTDYYEQVLKPTGVKDEYQMFYIKKTLSAEKEAEIAALIAAKPAET